MTDIEQKALALLNEVGAEQDLHYAHLTRYYPAQEALCRAIEQHEAPKQELSDFRQEVSDAADAATRAAVWAEVERLLDPFIIPAPKPDPLFYVLWELGLAKDGAVSALIHEKLDACGLEIREKNDAGK